MAERIRIPWPWENIPDQTVDAGDWDVSKHVALPKSEDAPRSSCVTGGETPGARETIDRLVGDLRSSGFSSESASHRARQAAIRWDRKHRS